MAFASCPETVREDDSLELEIIDKKLLSTSSNEVEAFPHLPALCLSAFVRLCLSFFVGACMVVCTYVDVRGQPQVLIFTLTLFETK